MERLQAALIVFILLYIIIFVCDYFFIKRRYYKKILKKNSSKRKKKVKDLTEVLYLVNKFNLDKEKLPMHKLLITISLSNALIISLVAVTVLLIDSYLIVQLLVGFVLLFLLIYAIYELIGRFLVKKGYGKNGK